MNMTKEEKHEQFINYIEGIVKGLREFGWTKEQAMGNMIVHLTSAGYLVKKKEYYIKDIK